MPSSREAVVYKCNLHRGGIHLLETIRLLKAFAVHGDFKRLSEEALKENLLGKTSTHTIKAMLQAFRRRFLNPHPSLPPAALVAQAVKAALPEVAKTQILFPYYLLSDALVADIYRELVLPQVSRGNGVLTRDAVLGFLEEKGRTHPELKKWAAYTKVRWARGMLAFLRDFGLLERAPGTKLRPFILRREAFAFYWLWLKSQGLAFGEAKAHELWPLLQVSGPRFAELVFAGQKEQWWRYEEAGGLVEFHTPFATVEEWLRSAVGFED